MNRPFIEQPAAALQARTAPPPPIPPQIHHWKGNATGNYWAYIPSPVEPRLIEAPTSDDLAFEVDRHLENARRARQAQPPGRAGSPRPPWGPR